ncbi:hypothetical protein Tco_0877833 [Tanacetum coccineum]|uniref:Zinc finger, CCHC-type n=1 Tax=Tanacetum coccineum TaxID=301880 RepID=A0ABQ5BZ68_9ASTR
MSVLPDDQINSVINCLTAKSNPICALRDYPKPSHEGYMNTIEQPVGNNVVPLRSDTIRLMQNGCSFYRPWSEDPNQHLKDFLKLVDSLDLDGENRERTRKNRAKTPQRYPDVSTTSMRNLVISQKTWDSFKELTTKIDDGKLLDRNDGPFKAISMPQDVSSISDRRLIELEKSKSNALMEAHLALTQPTQVNKITTFIYQMKLEKALVDFDSHQEKRLSSLRTQLGQQQDDMISKINLLWKAISKKLDDAPIRDTVGNSTAQMNFTSTNDPTREEL